MKSSHTFLVNNNDPDSCPTGYVGWETYRLKYMPTEKLSWELIITDESQVVTIAGNGFDTRLDILITELTALRDALVEDEQ